MKKDNKNQLEKKMDPYAMDRLHKVPFWIKVVLLKFWFFGAINLFMIMGIMASDANEGYWQWLAILSGAVCGAFYDLVINKLILLMESDKKEGHNFSMIISKKYYAMLINIIYFIVVFIFVYLFINLIGDFFHKTLKWQYTPGQEPFSFSLIVLLIDGIFLLIKFAIVQIIKKIKNKKNEA